MFSDDFMEEERNNGLKQEREELEKEKTPIGPLDIMIAGHTKSLGYTIVTNNTKEFERVKGLKLEECDNKAYAPYCHILQKMFQYIPLYITFLRNRFAANAVILPCSILGPGYGTVIKEICPVTRTPLVCIKLYTRQRISHLRVTGF